MWPLGGEKEGRNEEHRIEAQMKKERQGDKSIRNTQANKRLHKQKASEGDSSLSTRRKKTKTASARQIIDLQRVQPLLHYYTTH